MLPLHPELAVVETVSSDQILDGYTLLPIQRDEIFAAQFAAQTRWLSQYVIFLRPACGHSYLPPLDPREQGAGLTECVKNIGVEDTVSERQFCVSVVVL